MIDVVLDENQHVGTVRLMLAEDEMTTGSVRGRARLLLAGLLSWIVVLIAGAWVFAGPMVFLASLWVGRAMLAAAELLRWVTAALPDQTFPADPGSFFSLVDPPISPRPSPSAGSLRWPTPS